MWVLLNMAGCLPCLLISPWQVVVRLLAFQPLSAAATSSVTQYSLSLCQPYHLFSHYQFALRRKSSFCRPAEQLSPPSSAMYHVTPLSLSASQPSQAVNLACPSALLVQVSPVNTYHSWPGLLKRWIALSKGQAVKSISIYQTLIVLLALSVLINPVRPCRSPTALTLSALVNKLWGGQEAFSALSTYWSVSLFALSGCLSDCQFC